MSRMRVFFGLQGAEVLAGLRSWRLGDTSSTAVRKFQICVEGFCHIGWTQATMSRIGFLCGLRGAVVLARHRSLSLGDTSSTALSCGSRYV